MASALSSMQRRRVRQALRTYYTEQVTVHIPSVTAEGTDYDEFTGDVSDITIESKTVTWHVSTIPVKVSHLRGEAARIHPYKGVISSSEVGDVIITTTPEYHDLLELARNTRDAYVTVDSRPCTVSSVGYNHVEGVSSVKAHCTYSEYPQSYA